MGIFDYIASVGVSPTTVLIVLLLCLFIHRLLWRDKRKLPPFPKFWLPLIGHMHYMRADMRAPCRKLRAELGDVYSLQLGSRLAIVLGGYKTMKEAFVKQGDVFADRPFLKTLDAVIQDKVRFWLPLIGHMHYMRADMRAPCRKLRAELGDVYSLQLGSRLAIVLGGYKTMKEAFVKQGDVFTDRPFLKTLDAVIQDKGFVNRNGMPWKEHRRFVLSTLKDLGMGRRTLETKIQKEAAVMVQVINETNEAPFYPRPLVNTTVTNVISSMLFGDTFKHGDPLITGMLDTVEENIRYATLAAMLNFFPFLEYVPGDLFKMNKLITNANKIHKFCRDIVLEHQQRINVESSDDFTSAYLLALEERKASGEDTSFSIDNLGGTIADVFMAGSESTITAINWSILCMTIYPDVQKKLHEVILEQIGADKVPSVADRVRLPYVDAFYMEILRYCNLTPLLLPHAASRDTQLNGYTIPQEAMILVDIDSVANDVDIWGDPENFRPDRFIDDDGKLSKKEEFIFFFMGKRSCIGESLARMELFLILITLVQNFEFVCPENQSLSFEKVDGEFGISHGPKKYEVIAKKRQK